MEVAEIKKNIEEILDDNKAQSITTINLKNKSYIADYMIIASGTSSRHLQSLSEILVNELKKKGIENCINSWPFHAETKRLRATGLYNPEAALEALVEPWSKTTKRLL